MTQHHDSIDRLNGFCEANGIGWFDPNAVTIRAETRRAEFYAEKAVPPRVEPFTRKAVASRARLREARARLAIAAWKVRRRPASGSQPRAAVR